MTTPIENLLKLQEAAQAGAVSPEVAAWLDKGIEDFLSRQGTLDKCLCLTGGTGIRKAFTVYFTNKRNHHIKQAWLTLEAPTPWKRSVALVDEIKRFEACVWPHWCNLPTPPAGASKLRSQLFHAYGTGVYIPSSLSGIHEICSPMNGGY